MRNEEFEGRLQNLEVSMQAILIRLKSIEDGLHPKVETAFASPPSAETTDAADIPIRSGPPPIIADMQLNTDRPVENLIPSVPEYKWQTEAHDQPPVQRSATGPSEPIVAHERELLKPKIPDFMRENMSPAPQTASSAPPPSAPGAGASQFTFPHSASADDLEYKFGINGLLRGGAVVFVLALLFLVAIMVGRGAITPPVQFAGEIVLCLAFIGLGLKKRDEREDFGQLMVGIGSFGLYASFAGGYAYKHLYEGEPLVAMYMLLSLANLGFAFWRSSKSFLTIGMLGGLVAAMMPMHKDKAMLDFALHFLILAPCAAIIVRNKWNGMAGLMWLVSTAALIPATTSHFDQFWRVGATYLNCAIALYACGKVFKPSEFDKHAAIQTVMLVLTGFFAIAIDTGHKGSMHALVLTAVAAGIGYAIQENEKARNSTWLGGLIVFAIITPIGYTQSIAAFCYALEALVLVVLAMRFQLVALWAVGFSTFLFSCVAYLYFPDKNILSLARFSPSLELLLLAILATTVSLNIRYALPNKKQEIQEGAIFVGSGLLVAFFVRGLNVVLGNGNTSLHIGAINTLALGIASVVVLVIANRYQRISVFVLGGLTAITSYLFYLVAAPDGNLSFIQLAPPLDLALLAIFTVAVCLTVRFTLRIDNKDFQEVSLFFGGSLLVAFFIRGLNVLLGNGNTNLPVGDVNTLGIGLAGLALTLTAVLSKRKGLLIASTLLATWVGVLALVLDPEVNPHWMSPVLVVLAASCVLIGSKFIAENEDKAYEEPLMVFAGVILSAFFVRLMHLVGINHLLDLSKDTATYFSLGLLNIIWTGFALRNRRTANLVLGWLSFIVATSSGASMPPNSQPSWLSPVLLSIPLVALGFLYAITPRKESEEGPGTALCVIPGWFLSTLFLRQEVMRPWIGLNAVASYTAAWVIFAVFLIAIGFKFSRRHLRYWALAVFGITVGKVFLVDLSELDSVIRVAMLTLLGVGMMGGGYWYILWRRSQGVQPDPQQSVEGSVPE